MKITTIIIRTLLGALLLFASVSFLLNLMPQPELTGNVKLFMEGMMATGYMMPLIKVTELICGLALVTGLYVPLAAVILAPISINIFLFHLLVEPSGVVIGSFVLIANLFLGFAHWPKYRSIFDVR